MTSDSLIAGTVAEVIPRLGERMPTRGRGACANRPMLDERVAAGRASAPGLAQAGKHREVGVMLNLRHPRTREQSHPVPMLQRSDLSFDPASSSVTRCGALPRNRDAPPPAPLPVAQNRVRDVAQAEISAAPRA